MLEPWSVAKLLAMLTVLLLLLFSLTAVVLMAEELNGIFIQHHHRPDHIRPQRSHDVSSSSSSSSSSFSSAIRDPRSRVLETRKNGQLVIGAGDNRSNRHANKKIFCYFSSSAQYRKNGGKFEPEDMPRGDLCSHIIFTFAGIDAEKGQLKPMNWNDLSSATTDSKGGLYERTLALKKSSPRMKVLLAIGGWVVGSTPFTKVSKSRKSRARFARNVADYLRRYGFDGIDVDWEFPASRGSPSRDKYRFSYLLETLNEVFKDESRRTGNKKLLLTAAVAGGSYFMKRAYDIPEINRHVDFLLVMAYNYHGSWDKVIGHHSGLFPSDDDEGANRELNQEWTVRYWLMNGASPDKLIVGIPMYGMSFTLAKAKNQGHGIPTAHLSISGPGKAGQFTGERGTMAYFEICDKIESGAWTTEWRNDRMVPHMYGESDQWIGYENTRSVMAKANYIAHHDLAGAFIWSAELDDFSGSHCSQGRYPLLTAIRQSLQVKSRSLHVKLPAPSDHRSRKVTEERMRSGGHLRFSDSRGQVSNDRHLAVISSHERRPMNDHRRNYVMNNDNKNNRVSRQQQDKPCRGAGVFAHANDCSSYSVCVRHRRRWFRLRLRCPGGRGFDARTTRCVSDPWCIR